MRDETDARADLLSLAEGLADRMTEFRDHLLTAGPISSTSINIAIEVVREINEDLTFMASDGFKSGRLAEIEAWLNLCTEALKHLYGLRPSGASIH